MGNEKKLARLVAQRAAQRLSTDDMLVKLQSTLVKGDPGELTKVKTQLKGLKLRYNAVSESDEKILTLLDDDEEINSDILESQRYNDKVNVVLSEAEVYIDDAAANINTKSTDNGGKGAKVKLPQLRLSPFDGDPLKWEEFWDTFESTVHNNEDLATIDKFKYLKEFLEGNVLLLAEGYRMTAANYDAVVDQLKQRYGDKELTIQAHFDALLSLRPGSGNVEDLQRVYDECEVHIRSLVALDMDESTFGRVFAPLIKSKLPENIRLELERRHHGGPWNLPDLRQLLRSEIHARRMSKVTLGTTQNTTYNSDEESEHSCYGKSEKYDSSASVLVANAQSGNKPRRPCAFCREFSHFHDQCTTYPDLKTRAAALKGACQLCLGRNHQTSSCYWTSQVRCVHCYAVGRHHRSLCPQKFGTSESVDQSLLITALESVPQAYSMVSATVESPGRQGLVVMQTALATVKGTKNTEKVRLLFDTASNRSFARSDFLKRIGARSLGVETLAVAGLGNDRRKTKLYEAAEMDLILECGSIFTLQVNGLSIISSKIQKQAVDTNQYPVLRGLTFSDPMVDKPEFVQVDILIGLDYYHSLVGTEQCRIGDFVVTDTKVGLIASGSIPQKSKENTPPKYDTALMVSAIPVKPGTCPVKPDYKSSTTDATCKQTSPELTRNVLAHGADTNYITFIMLWIVWFIAISLGCYLLADGSSRGSSEVQNAAKPFPSGSGKSSAANLQSFPSGSDSNPHTTTYGKRNAGKNHTWSRSCFEGKGPRHTRWYPRTGLAPGTTARTLRPQAPCDMRHATCDKIKGIHRYLQK